MAKVKFLICSKCKQKAETKTNVIPHIIGTSIKMHCSDCDGLEHPIDMPRYQGGLATMCRECCPTGHGTKWQGEQ